MDTNKARRGHGRTPRPKLPVVEEIRDLVDDDKCCPHCGEAFLPFPGFEEADVIEIHVRGTGLDVETIHIAAK